MYKLFIPDKKRSWKHLHIRLSYAKYKEVSNLVITARDHLKILPAYVLWTFYNENLAMKVWSPITEIMFSSEFAQRKKLTH